jgi:GTPase
LLLPTGTGNESPVLPPKLAAERDKEGHIEYKLKLIDPSPERFGKLVTQMMWRLKQGKNEAIYEIGLAGESSNLLDASMFG